MSEDNKINTGYDSIPTAQAIGVGWHVCRAKSCKSNFHWVIRVRCPYCGGIHSHGGGAESTAPYSGHRAADCGKGGYYLPEYKPA